jgi:hypothetical protein
MNPPLKSYTNLAIDIETLALDTKAPVIQIGVVPFSLEGEGGILLEQAKQFDIDPTTYFPNEYNERAYGDQFSEPDTEDTVVWHARQNPTYLMQLASSGVNLRTAASNFFHWITDYSKICKEYAPFQMYFWRSHFDYPILRNFMDTCGYPDWVNFRHVHCAFSLVDDHRKISPILNAPLEIQQLGTLHTALRDAGEMAWKLVQRQKSMNRMQEIVEASYKEDTSHTAAMEKLMPAGESPLMALSSAQSARLMKEAARDIQKKAAHARNYGAGAATLQHQAKNTKSRSK